MPAGNREDRLGLLELLLTSDDPAECAERAGEILCESAGAKQVICLAMPAGPPVLRFIASVGRPATRELTRLSVDLEDQRHPLVRALLGGSAVVLDQPRSFELGDVRLSPLLLIPLLAGGTNDELPIGALLIRPASTPIEHATWVAEKLGCKLAQLRRVAVLGDVQRRLAGQAAQLQRIIDAVSDPIVLTDAGGRKVLSNRRAELLLSAVDGDSEGRRRAVALNNLLFSAALPQMHGAEPITTHREFALVDPIDGADLVVELMASVVGDVGEGTGIVSVLRNVTELRRATDELEREALEKVALYEQLKLASSELERRISDATTELVHRNELLLKQHLALEQASRLKSQFLANISHELRTPLNAILGYTSMLLQGIGGELNDKQRTSLERVDSNGRHLLTLINDILDIAKIEAKKATLELSLFAISELVSEVVAELGPLIRCPEIEFRMALGERLPLLQADRQKLKQILVNLIGNARKFTRRGSIVVSANYHEPKTELELAVTDTGIGIAREDHARIFEDFRQVDSSPTREYGGAGLGLAVCRRLASLMNAELSLQSELGKGSTFFVRLPGPFEFPETASLAVGGTFR